MAGDRDDVARRLDRLLLGLAPDVAAERLALAILQPPEVRQDVERHPLEALRQLGVGPPRPEDRRREYLARLALQLRGHDGARLVEHDVALALLLRVVERKRVQERPDQLAGDARERELEGCVLEHRMVSTVEGEGADPAALALGHLLGADDPIGVAGPRSGDRAVVGALGRGPQADLGARVDHLQSAPHLRQTTPVEAPPASNGTSREW